MKSVFSIIFYIFMFILIIYVNNFELEDLNSPVMFMDEICSYNGKINESSNNWTCECQEEYSDLLPYSRKINNIPVQCTYEKKRRFIALFLSIFLPLGFDYLYLGRYFIFILILMMCLVTLFGNCYRFAVSPHHNYLNNKINLIFVILALFMITLWVVNIALIWTGIVYDGNGIGTVNDIYFLININNQ